VPGTTAFDEEVAAHYEAWYETEEGRHADALEKTSLRKLLNHLPAARSVLEVGCGTGHFTRWLEEQGLWAVGLDLSAAMLSEAETGNQISLVQADAHRLPFADHTFDLTAFVATLEFLEAPGEALTEAARVSSRALFLGVLNRWSALAVRRRLIGLIRPTVYDEARFYSVGELRHLLRTAVVEARDRGDGGRWRIIWHTTLFPPWIPWERARVLWGGFIAMALLTPGQA